MGNGDTVYYATGDAEAAEDLHDTIKNGSTSGTAYLILGLLGDAFLGGVKLLGNFTGTVFSAAFSSKGAELSDPKDATFQTYKADDDHVVVKVTKIYKGGEAN